MIAPTDFGFGDYSFSWGDHICAIFDSHAQQMDVMGGFLSAGVRAEQRCVWVAPQESAEAMRAELRRMGGDPPTLEASGQLLVISEVDFYIGDRVFDPDRTLELVWTLLRDNQREGYGAMRVCSDVSWLGGGQVDPDVWEEFESRVTEEVRSLPLAMVCQYDRRQVSGSVIVAALRTHPTVILGEVFRQNPFYEPVPGGARDSRDVI